MRRSSEVYRRSLERRKRHDEAARLRDAAPGLEHLAFEIVERRASLPGHEVHHKRFVVVDRAPAVFEFGCSDRACGDIHELTDAILPHLRRREAAFSVTSICVGESRGAPCRYELTVNATARYAESVAPPSGTTSKVGKGRKASRPHRAAS